MQKQPRKYVRIESPKMIVSNTGNIGHKDQEVELLTLELEGVPQDADAKQIKQMYFSH